MSRHGKKFDAKTIAGLDRMVCPCGLRYSQIVGDSRVLAVCSKGTHTILRWDAASADWDVRRVSDTNREPFADRKKRRRKLMLAKTKRIKPAGRKKNREK